jgi:hypothetical protein
MNAAMSVGHLAGPGGGVLDIPRAASAPPPDRPARPIISWMGLAAAYFSAGHPAGVTIYAAALSAFGRAATTGEELRWPGLACVVAVHLAGQGAGQGSHGRDRSSQSGK